MVQLRNRRTIRAPKRFEDTVQTSHETPDGQTGKAPGPDRQHRRTLPPHVRPAFPLQYIDYNPNLPPAAFPTLDPSAPRPQLNNGMYARSNQTLVDGANGPAGEGQGTHGDPMDIDGADKTNENSDGEGVEVMGGMESSDDDDDENAKPYGDGYQPEEFKPPEKIEWNDLTAALRFEIVDNMSVKYQRDQIMVILCLSLRERRELVEQLTAIDKQLEVENRFLVEMQKKQCRQLMRLDSSLPKDHRVPGMLIFKNLAKKYYKILSLNSEPEYLMSRASDVMIAREWLRRIGSDPDYAGKWTNGWAEIKMNPYAPGEEKLGWIFDTNETREHGIEQDTVAQLETKKITGDPDEKPNPKLKDPFLQTKLDFINCFGKGPLDPYNVVSIQGARVKKLINRRNKHHIRHVNGPTIPPAAANSASLSGRYGPTLHPHGSAVPSITTNPTLNPHGHGTIRLSVDREGAARTHSVVAKATGQNPPNPVDSAPAQRPSSKKFQLTVLQRPQSGNSEERPGKPGHDSLRLSANGPNATKQHKLPVKRSLAGAWWYNSTKEDWKGPPTAPAGNRHEKALAGRAEAAIRGLQTDVAADSSGQSLSTKAGWLESSGDVGTNTNMPTNRNLNGYFGCFALPGVGEAQGQPTTDPNLIATASTGSAAADDNPNSSHNLVTDTQAASNQGVTQYSVTTAPGGTQNNIQFPATGGMNIGFSGPQYPVTGGNIGFGQIGPQQPAAGGNLGFGQNGPQYPTTGGNIGPGQNGSQFPAMMAPAIAQPTPQYVATGFPTLYNPRGRQRPGATETPNTLNGAINQVLYEAYNTVDPQDLVLGPVVNAPDNAEVVEEDEMMRDLSDILGVAVVNSAQSHDTSQEQATASVADTGQVNTEQVTAEQAIVEQRAPTAKSLPKSSKAIAKRRINVRNSAGRKTTTGKRGRPRKNPVPDTLQTDEGHAVAASEIPSQVGTQSTNAVIGSRTATAGSQAIAAPNTVPATRPMSITKKKRTAKETKPRTVKKKV